MHATGCQTRARARTKRADLEAMSRSSKPQTHRRRCISTVRTQNRGTACSVIFVGGSVRKQESQESRKGASRSTFPAFLFPDAGTVELIHLPATVPTGVRRSELSRRRSSPKLRVGLVRSSSALR